MWYHFMRRRGQDIYLQKGSRCAAYLEARRSRRPSGLEVEGRFPRIQVIFTTGAERAYATSSAMETPKRPATRQREPGDKGTIRRRG